MLNPPASFKMGLDIGSTTVKIVLLDGDKVIYQQYRRHHSDIRGELIKAFEDLQAEFPALRVQLAITGSGGLSVATWLGLEFVQEVIAETVAITRYNPQTDIIISYTHLRAHETDSYLVCRLLLEKKKHNNFIIKIKQKKTNKHTQKQSKKHTQ